MDSILVKGGGTLHGAIPIAGAKNACLALYSFRRLLERMRATDIDQCAAPQRYPDDDATFAVAGR